MKKTGKHVYSTQMLFLVILILVVMFTVVIFSQIQCKKHKVYSLLVRSSLFGHLYSVILTSLELSTNYCILFPIVVLDKVQLGTTKRLQLFLPINTYGSDLIVLLLFCSFIHLLNINVPL